MKLAREAGRLPEWENLLDELQPQQLAVLEALHRIEPWGEERADLRSALNTAIIVNSINGAEIDIGKLSDYLNVEKTQNSGFQSPNSAAAMMRQRYPSTVKT